MPEDNPFITPQELSQLFGVKRNKLMHGEWLVQEEETEDERELRLIAEAYHSDCDSYDRKVCSGTSPRSGEPMPVNGYELGLVNKHARDVIETFVKARPQYSREQIWKAIQKYSRQGGHQ